MCRIVFALILGYCRFSHACHSHISTKCNIVSPTQTSILAWTRNTKENRLFFFFFGSHVINAQYCYILRHWSHRTRHPNDTTCRTHTVTMQQLWDEMKNTSRPINTRTYEYGNRASCIYTIWMWYRNWSLLKQWKCTQIIFLQKTKQKKTQNICTKYTYWLYNATEIF